MPGVTLDRLKSVICQLKEKANEHDVKFASTLRNCDLLAFENENTVRLPEDYRLFLTLVGNGGPSGPCREGLLPLGKVPTLLYDKRTRILGGLPDLFPFTEPSVVTCGSTSEGSQQQLPATNNNSNSDESSDENPDTGVFDSASDEMGLDTFDEMGLDTFGGSENQGDDDTDASDSSDNDVDDDAMDGYGIDNSNSDGSSSSTNDEDNDDKHLPTTQTIFKDLFNLYNYPPFSIQWYDASTLNNSIDSRMNNDDGDNGNMTIPMVGGYLILGTMEHSRHYFWILIASGSNRGEVWIMNTNGFYFPTNPRMQFHQWIDDWISGGDNINASVWTCGLYDLQLRSNSLYLNRNNNYTSIYDSSTSSEDDQDDDGDTDTDCSYDDYTDTDSFGDDDDMTV